MITRIILGAAALSGEVAVSGDAHPAAVRAVVRALHLGQVDEIVVATWSPIALAETLLLWQADTALRGTRPGRILLRSPGGDVPLSALGYQDGQLEFSSPVEKLVRGELDAWLGGATASADDKTHNGTRHEEDDDGST